MDDLGSIPAYEMLERRRAGEKEIGDLLGQLVFGYSRFVDALHLCVAWRNGGKDLSNHGALAENLGTFELLRIIEKQACETFGIESPCFKKYKLWVARAHRLREIRNVLMHSRWGIDAYGRHATAVSTPLFVEPPKTHVVTTAQLRKLCDTSSKLISELSALRNEHPL